jgi:hypothetical protein
MIHMNYEGFAVLDFWSLWMVMFGMFSSANGDVMCVSFVYFSRVKIVFPRRLWKNFVEGRFEFFGSLSHMFHLFWLLVVALYYDISWFDFVVWLGLFLIWFVLFGLFKFVWFVWFHLDWFIWFVWFGSAPFLVQFCLVWFGYVCLCLIDSLMSILNSVWLVFSLPIFLFDYFSLDDLFCNLSDCFSGMISFFCLIASVCWFLMSHCFSLFGSSI